MAKILEVKDLNTVFHVKAGDSRVVNDFSIELEEGHLLGIVGESGSGKTVTAMSIMGAVKSPGDILSGEVLFKGEDILSLPEEKSQNYRGKLISMVTANARGHLNPLMDVGTQISNVYLAHNPNASKAEARNKVVDMLKAVGINDAERRYKAYPHELSGGMAQRIMIAMALINSPQLLLADDATNGLDVTVQAQIMELITSMIKKDGMSAIFITHDLGVVAQCCDEIAIIYCGKVVEYSKVSEFFKGPKHPYSRKLLYSLAEYSDHRLEEEKSKEKPNPLALPSGCHYHPRCPYAKEECVQQVPPKREYADGCYVRCFSDCYQGNMEGNA